MKPIERRKFLQGALLTGAAMLLPSSTEARQAIQTWTLPNGYKPADHYWSMGIDSAKCIGCGLCVEGCKTENHVPKEPYFFRTWVERYQIEAGHAVLVDSPNGGMRGFPKPNQTGKPILNSFFVPKLCNQCDNPPCVQVCPVGATFKTPDGVILVDAKYCVGCRYCIQACPYGARYFHPETRTADKCTFCYHRITQGKLPVCVEVCPTQARIFGEFKQPASPVTRLRETHQTVILKPELNTVPKVFYANLDAEVR